MKPLLRDWLALQCQLISGTEAALLVIRSSAGATLRASWPEDVSPRPRLSATLEVALERGQPSVQEASAGADAMAGLAHIAVPLLRDGHVHGALAVSVRGVTAGDSKAICQRSSAGFPVLLRLLEIADDRARTAALMTSATRLLDHEELAPAAHALAFDLARDLGCERVSIGLLRGGRLRVSTLSSNVQFSDESRAIRDLADAMQEAFDQDLLIVLPSPDEMAPTVAEAHETLLEGSGAGAVCSVPLPARGRAIGAMTCEWTRAEAPTLPALDRIRETALLCGPILEWMVRAERTPRERISAWMSRLRDRHFGSMRLATAVFAAVALGVCVLAVTPGSYRVSARASLEGRVQRALVALVPGYVSEAHARAGDLVEEGQVLARLDDRDLVLEQRKWESQGAQLEREHREALASQDRAQVSILRAQIDQAAAELGLVQEALGRTRVVAPFDGIVLEGDLDRSLGSPVQQGDVLFELAPLDGYRVIVEVDGRNIADVEAGRRGWLTLAALPDRPMELVVERITPISTVRDGRNYFRVEAALEDPGRDLRPGMEGIAKIEAGRRRLLWIWTHELVDWLRLRLWSFLP